MSVEIMVLEERMREHRVAPELMQRIVAALNEGYRWRLEATRLQHEVDRLTPHVPPEIAKPPAKRYMGNYVKRTGD